MVYLTTTSNKVSVDSWFKNKGKEGRSQAALKSCKHLQNKTVSANRHIGFSGCTKPKLESKCSRISGCYIGNSG